MANLSSAFGEITFKNKDITDLARFIYYDWICGYQNHLTNLSDYSFYL